MATQPDSTAAPLRTLRTVSITKEGLAREVRLSARELECARVIALGQTDHQARETLNISMVTVRFHMDNIKRKLGSSNRTHAIYLLTKAGAI